MQYLRLCRRDTVQTRALLQRRYGDVHAAVEIHEAGNLQTVEVQARLLAGQDLPTLATTMAIAPEVIRLYESLFFHVVEQREARAWIEEEVFSKPPGGPALDQSGDFLRRIAYEGGPLALEAALRKEILPQPEPDAGSLDLMVEELLERIHLVESPTSDADPDAAAGARHGAARRKRPIASTTQEPEAANLLEHLLLLLKGARP